MDGEHHSLFFQNLFMCLIIWLPRVFVVAHRIFVVVVVVCSPRERGSERVNQSRALVRTPRVRALGAFPVQDRCSSPSPRPPKGTSPHPSEMPPELRKMPAQKAASTLTTPPLPFLDLVIQHTLIRCGCSQPKTGLQMCLPFHHATGPLSSTAGSHTE